ncbi:unnamed protein product, partial [Staurois parvus]
LSVPVSAAYQCHLSVPVSADYQCQSVLPINVHQCSLSMSITAASLAHISKGEKNTNLQNCITKTKKKIFFFQ